ncbi:MAG: 6-bladed beta-propeller [Candidatus Aegiribacteria sp.]|nr:6-bladed beta-propeller [Candidatus Aegiribacteria sp.]
MRYCMNTSAGILIVISIIMLIGCGADETTPELPDIEYKLVITDSIGVEIGDDEYILGWPISPTHSPDGNIVFADRMKHAVFMYTPEGEFIRTIGREGEGPGEFHRPFRLKFYSDGSMLIEDWDGISLFDSNYCFVNRMTWSLFTPSLITALDDGGFIGEENTPRPAENRILWVSTLARWEDGDEEPSVEYFSIEYEWNIGSEATDFSESREEDIICCATRDGLVFYSRSSIDEFVIHGCEPDGTPFLHIEDEAFHRVRKSDEDIQAERDTWISLIRMMRGDSSPPIPFTVDPYRRVINDMFLDGGERLWVRLGCYPGIVFRVYDFSGEILFHAMVEYSGNPADLNSWEITGDEHGFLAINTSQEYSQKVYMLTLVEAE